MARGRKKRPERNYKNPNGFGSVVKLSGNRRRPYDVQVTTGWKLMMGKDGKPRKRQIYDHIAYTETYEEGMQILIEYNKRKKQGVTITKPTATFKEIYDAVMPGKFEGKSKAYISYYGLAFKRLTPIHNIPVRDLTTSSMQKLIDIQIADGKCEKIQRTMKTICNRVFEYAMRERVTDMNYAQFLDIKPAERKIFHTVFSNEEVHTLWKYADQPYVDSILIMLYTGLRLGELLGLRKDMIHLDERYIITGSKTAAGRNRIIPIAHPIEHFIKNLYLNTNDALFSIKGDNYRNNVFKPFMKKIGMSHLPHDCRYTFISYCDTMRMSKTVLQKIVGHAGKDITEKVYIHKGADELIAAVDAIWPDSSVGYLSVTHQKIGTSK